MVWRFFVGNCEVVTFPFVSWVRCGALSYRFLIFVLFLLCFVVWLWLFVLVDQLQCSGKGFVLFYKNCVVTVCVPILCAFTLSCLVLICFLWLLHFFLFHFCLLLCFVSCLFGNHSFVISFDPVCFCVQSLLWFCCCLCFNMVCVFVLDPRLSRCGSWCLFKNSKWVWSENTTITNCRLPRGIARKSRSTITRHQEDKLSKAISSLFPIKMIAKLERT